MPNCFQLSHKLTGKPIGFALIDDAICNHFGVTPDPVMYYLGWYDVIGFAIACGRPLGSDALRSFVADTAPRLVPVLAYLEARYTSDAWAERGRR